MLKFWLVIVVWTVTLQSDVFASTGLYNVTAQRKLAASQERNKRFLIFPDSSSRKFTSSIGIPIQFGDKKPWRSCSVYTNLQSQYQPIPVPIYPWDKWEGRTLMDAKYEYEKYGTYAKDEFRVMVYSLIEYYVNHTGRNGRQCLLRAICDNALTDQVDDIVSRIIILILRPSDDSDEEYKDAYKAGRYGVECISMYPECPLGKGILDGHTVIESSLYFARKRRALRDVEAKQRAFSLVDMEFWDSLTEVMNYASIFF